MIINKVCDAAVNVLTPMNPLIKITAISDASTSSILDSATLTVSHFTFSKHMERTPHFLTLALGLSAVAFLRPSLESPSLERSLELLQNGTYEISAELGAIILMSKEKISRSDLIHMDDLELTNLLGNSKLDQTTMEKPQAKIKRLLKDWESEFCPVYSIIGSILSQEVVNFFKDADQVTSGWLVYDSLIGTAKMLAVAENSK